METLSLMFVLLSLTKFIISPKMMLMLISLEISSIFLFSLLTLSSSIKGGMATGLYSIFLVFSVCESVIILIGMLNVFRKGSLMTKSLFTLKF